MMLQNTKKEYQNWNQNYQQWLNMLNMLARNRLIVKKKIVY